jgi:hypothetical protein
MYDCVIHKRAGQIAGAGPLHRIEIPFDAKR